MFKFLSTYSRILQILSNWPYLQPMWYFFKVVENKGLLIYTIFVIPVCCHFFCIK